MDGDGVVSGGVTPVQIMFLLKEQNKSTSSIEIELNENLSRFAQRNSTLIDGVSTHSPRNSDRTSVSCSTWERDLRERRFTRSGKRSTRTDRSVERVERSLSIPVEDVGTCSMCWSLLRILFVSSHPRSLDFTDDDRSVGVQDEQHPRQTSRVRLWLHLRSTLVHLLISLRADIDYRVQRERSRHTVTRRCSGSRSRRTSSGRRCTKLDLESRRRWENRTCIWRRIECSVSRSSRRRRRRGRCVTSRRPRRLPTYRIPFPNSSRNVVDGSTEVCSVYVLTSSLLYVVY